MSLDPSPDKSFLARVRTSAQTRLRDKIVIRLVARHEEPYATHMPVLCGLGSVLTVERVLELGSGLHSTPLFLNRAVFPALKELVSVETDRSWAGRVQELVGDDSRLTLEVVSSVATAVAQRPNLDAFDLILVDDSDVPEDRAATIAAVVAQQPRGIVVVHDFDVPVYRQAARLPGRHVMRAFNPQSAVFAGSALSLSTARRLRRVLNQHASTVSPTDVITWSNLFAEYPR